MAADSSRYAETPEQYLCKTINMSLKTNPQTKVELDLDVYKRKVLNLECSRQKFQDCNGFLFLFCAATWHIIEWNKPVLPHL